MFNNIKVFHDELIMYFAYLILRAESYYNILKSSVFMLIQRNFITSMYKDYVFKVETY